MIHPTPDPARVGQESVWDFPRPAVAVQPFAHLKIIYFGLTIVETLTLPPRLNPY